jgi:SOS-response transcriptional repressor LexA
MATDSPAAAALKALRKRVPKLSVRALAQEVGWGHSSYQYYEDDYKGEYLPWNLVQKLIEVLPGRGVPPITAAEIGALIGPRFLEDPKQVLVPAPAVVQGSNSWPRDVPILGVSVGGNDGDFQLNFGADPADYAKRPPALQKSGKIFALYVQGTSMSRWREPGQLVYLDPVRPAKPGDHVVVECHPEQDGEGHPAYLKELVGRTTTRLRLKQYNPETVIEIPLSRVKHIHRVMEWEELLGV